MAAPRVMKPLLWFLAITPALWMIFALFTGGLGAEPVEGLEHFTGRWTLRYLVLTLAVTPVIRITGRGWLIAARRFLGLTAFFWCATHLLIYIGIDKFFDVGDIVEDVTQHRYVTLGMLAFLLLLPLALTSTKRSVRRLGSRNWVRLHRLIYPAVIAACIHFLWAVKSDYREPLIYTAIFVLLLGFRLIPRRALPAMKRQAPVR